MALFATRIQGSLQVVMCTLPPCHICPLVDQERKVPVALYPLCKHVVQNGFTCRLKNKTFFKLFAMSNSDQCKFWAELEHDLPLFL